MLRMAVVLCLSAGLIGSAPAGTVTVSPLVMAGDVYNGGNISPGFSSVARLEINSSGSWAIATNISLGIGDAIIRGDNGTPPGMTEFVDGQSVTSGHAISFFGRLSVNNSGVLAFLANYGSTSSGVHMGPTVQVAVQETAAPSPPFTPGTNWEGFFGGIINDGGQMLILGTVDDPAIASSVDRALVRVDDPLGTPAFVSILKEGDEVVPGRFLADVMTNPHTWSFAGPGGPTGSWVLVTPDLDGDGFSDTGLWRHDGTTGAFVAREGEPCPAVPGRNWFNFGSTTSASDINNSGAWAAKAMLDNSSTSNDLIIVRNGTDLIAREGSPVPALPSFNFTSFGTGAVKIDDSGNVFYVGIFNDPVTGTNTGLFRNSELLVRRGVTTAATGELVTEIATVQDNFSISDNGRWVLFEGDLTNEFSFTRRGTIIVDLGSGCPADFNGDGAASVQDIFDFLGAYFASSSSADVNDDGSVTVQDIFDYLGLYFTGCN